MKQLIKTALIVACISISSCAKEKMPTAPNTVRITVIEDPTDPRSQRLLPDPILSIYNFSESPDQEADFRFTYISDRRLNPIVEYHLANGQVTGKNNKSDDQDYRGKLVTLFYGKVRKTFADYHSQYDSVSSIPFSECFYAIASELTQLAANPATSKYLIAHSDLLEKSNVFDCYCECGRLLMSANSRLIADSFLRSRPVPLNMAGITVVFVFSARTREEEELFLEMVEVYKLMLEPRHARVIVQSDNKFFYIQ